MRPTTLASMLIAAALLAGGCKDESSPTSTPPAPSSPAAPASPTAGDTTTPPAVTPGATPGGAPVATPPANAAGAANDASAAAVTKANELLQQGLQYVKENKLDLAEKALTQLEGMKAQLPTDWAPKIDQLRTAINAAKVGGGKLPGLGK